MIHAVIIDDERDAVSSLQALLTDYCPEVKVLGTAGTALEAIKEIQVKKPNLVFLDIKMPHGSGFNVLESFPERNFHVIFITAYNQYAIQAIKFSALDYLLKPFDLDELKDALKKIAHVPVPESLPFQALQDNLREDNALHRLVLPTQHGFILLEIANLIYCKADGSYVEFYFKNGNNYIVSRQLGEYEELLKAYHFFRIHHSYLINLNHIKEYTNVSGGQVRLSNDAVLSVSVRRRGPFLRAIKQLNI